LAANPLKESLNIILKEQLPQVAYQKHFLPGDGGLVLP
jgi:hypothetical protein